MKLQVEERLDSILITIPREVMMCRDLSVEFCREVNQLKEKYGELKFREYSDNPKDFTTLVILDKEIE